VRLVLEHRGEGRGPKTGSREPRQVREEATVAVRSGLRCLPALSSVFEPIVWLMVVVLVGCSGRSGTRSVSSLPVLGCPENTREVVRALEQWCERDGVRQGPWRGWHSPVLVRGEGRYEDGRRYGLWTEWYDNGSRKSSGSYGGAGLRQGAWSWWFADGVPSAVGSYEGGDAHGAWTHWYPTGARASAGTYLHGENDGDWSFWHPSGALRAAGLFARGEQLPGWRFSDEDGHPMTESQHLAAYGPLP